MTLVRNDRLVSVRDAASVYGCSVATVWRRVASGNMPRPIKIGGSTRWFESEILEHIEAAKIDRDAA